MLLNAPIDKHCPPLIPTFSFIESSTYPSLVYIEVRTDLIAFLRRKITMYIFAVIKIHLGKLLNKMQI